MHKIIFAGLAMTVLVVLSLVITASGSGFAGINSATTIAATGNYQAMRNEALKSEMQRSAVTDKNQESVAIEDAQVISGTLMVWRDPQTGRAMSINLTDEQIQQLGSCH